MPDHPVIATAQRFRAATLAREREAANRLVQTYGRAYTRLGDSIKTLSEMVGKLDNPDRADVVRLSALKSLQRQVEEEINRFAVYADTEISRAATAAVQAGLTDSRALAASAMGSAQGQRALIAGWDMLPTESVETMLGFLGDDSPLHSALVNRLGPAVAERMGNALVDGIVLGMNPRQVAKIVQKELGVGLTWAMTTARTAQLYAYREASRANYVANSHIVEGWTWFAALDSRVCLSCVNQHGSFHPVTETLNDHHSGRCVALPEIKQAKAFGLPQPEIEPGEQWFNRQTEATQRTMMGPGMFDAWKEGKFAFGDLSQPYSDPVYGEMLREASLKGLLSGSKGRRPTFVKPVRVAVADAVAPKTAASVREQLTSKFVNEQQQLKRLNDELAALRDQRKQLYANRDFDAYAKKSEEIAEKAEEYNTMRREIAGKAREVVQVEKPASVKLNLVSKFSAKDPRLAEFETGKVEFERLVSSDVLKDGSTINVKAGGKRSHYINSEKVMGISPGGKSSVVIHEMGHWLEYSDPAIHEKALAFLERRTAGEKAVKLNKLFPGHGYGADEITKKDKFEHPYTGKIYMRGGVQNATEIVSMGLEAMYTDPVAFASSDPDFFDFIFNLARGQ